MIKEYLVARLLGAILGSSLAIVFNTKGHSPVLLLQRFVIGAIIGFVSAPVIIDYIGWQHTFDYWLAAATLGGMLGYLVLQMVFSDRVLERFLPNKK